MDATLDVKAILDADAKYHAIQKKFSYGTSGFRTLGGDLERVSDSHFRSHSDLESILHF